jgi:hypothetical protein
MGVLVEVAEGEEINPGRSPGLNMSIAGAMDFGVGGVFYLCGGWSVFLFFCKHLQMKIECKKISQVLYLQAF